MASSNALVTIDESERSRVSSHSFFPVYVFKRKTFLPCLCIQEGKPLGVYFAQLLVGASDVTRQLVDPRAVHRVHDPEDIVALAQFVQNADGYTKATVGGKLALITDQIRHLQAQAQQVIAVARPHLPPSLPSPPPPPPPPPAHYSDYFCRFWKRQRRIWSLREQSAISSDDQEILTTYTAPKMYVPCAPGPVN